MPSSSSSNSRIVDTRGGGRRDSDAGRDGGTCTRGLVSSSPSREIVGIFIVGAFVRAMRWGPLL